MNEKTILVVEDEPALLEAVTFKLKQQGVHVLAASTGEDALAILENAKPSLIWLDILLPGINGLDVLNHVRSKKELADIPVVIVSVSAGPEKIKEAFSRDVTDYIVKSEYSIDEIVHRVSALL
jgi:DNA-binding response OmpR family regulator